jgi:hypothetical protein
MALKRDTESNGAVYEPNLALYEHGYGYEEVHQAPVVVQSPKPPIVPVDPSEYGFEGLKTDAFTFRRITLNGTTFEIAGENLGNSFVCTFVSSRPIYRMKGKPDSNDKKDIYYSTDKLTTSVGISYEAARAALLAKGKEVEEEERLEISAIMADSEEFVLLDISKTSVPRASGYIIRCGMSGTKVTEHKTRVYLGQKVQSAFPFYPWAFEKV